MKKIDVAVCVRGKPYQTLRSLVSLLHHSGQYIKRIYFQEELSHPYNDAVSWIPRVLRKRIEVVHFKNEVGGIFDADDNRIADDNYRHSIRYQRAWEETDSILCLIHNDMLFTSDDIGQMLELMTEEYVGVGQIGQCWNCFAYSVCGGGQGYENFNPTYNEASAIAGKIVPTLTPRRQDRAKLFKINEQRPMPLPECRLNEFVCLIDVPKLKREVIPIGNIQSVGDGKGGDTGANWFRQLVLKGYRFKHYDFMATHIVGRTENILKDEVAYADIYWQQEEQAKRDLIHWGGFSIGTVAWL